MSGFVDKLKKFLKEELLLEGGIKKRGPANSNNSVAMDAIGWGEGGSVGRTSGTSRGLGDAGKNYGIDVNSAAEMTKQGYNKTIIDLAMAQSNDKESSDPGWKTEVKEYGFPALSEIVGQPVNMILTEQTGKFLQDLFGKILSKVKGVTATFQSKKENLSTISQINDYVKETRNVDFVTHNRQFLDFIKSDGRFYPDSYVVTITIPIERYNEDSVKQICEKYGITTSGSGITMDEVPTTIDLRFTINCASTLLNVYTTKEFFRVGSAHSSLEKFAWMSKQIRNIFNKNAEQSKKNRKMSGKAPDKNDELNDVEYINTDRTKDVGISPIQLFAKVYNSFITGRNDVFCLLDETEESYIYIPGTETKTDDIYELDALEEDTPVGKLQLAIKQYIEGMLSKEEFKGKCKEIIGNVGFSRDTKYAIIDDKIINIIKAAFDRRSGKGIQVEDEISPDGKTKTTKDNFDEALVKPITDLLTAEFGAPTEPRYDDVVKMIKSVKNKAIFFYEEPWNFEKLGANLIHAVEEEFDKNLTTNKLVRNTQELLTDDLSRKHVYRFMYQDKVNVTYKMSLPSKTAQEVMKAAKINPDEFPLGSQLPIFDVFVPGSEELPRKMTCLNHNSKLQTEGPDKGFLGNSEWSLTTTAEDIVRNPAGSMYGMKYTSNSQIVPDEYRSSSHIMNIFSMRELLGKIIDMYYFEPTTKQLQDLMHGKDIVVGEDIYHSDSPNVLVALDADRGRGKTLIKRIRNQSITSEQFGQKAVIDYKTIYKSNNELIDIVFSDYYDAVVNMRHQLDEFIRSLHILTDEEFETLNRSSLTNRSGNPTMVKRVINGMVSSIKSSTNHETTYASAVSDALVSSHLAEVFSSYINFLRIDKKIDVINKKKKKKDENLPKVMLSDITQEKKFNFAGNNIFVNGDRDAWLNGNVGPIIPFFEAYKNKTLNDDLAGVFTTSKSGNIGTKEILIAYYRKMCELCEVVKNFEKLQISDGCRTRQYTKRTNKRGAAWRTIIDTNLPASKFRTGTTNGPYEMSYEEAKRQTIRDATAADINSGFISSPFIHRQFAPVMRAIKRTITEFKEKYKKSPPAIDDTTTEGVIPLCPYNTIMFAIIENDHLVICMESSLVSLRETDALAPTTDVRYDGNEGIFRFSEEMIKNMTDQQKKYVLGTMANKDVVYCMANIFERDYISLGLRIMFDRYKQISENVYKKLMSRIKKTYNRYIKDALVPKNTPEEEIRKAVNDYIKNNGSSRELAKFFIDHNMGLIKNKSCNNDLMATWIYMNMVDVVETKYEA